MKKRLYVLGMLLILILSLVGCGDKPSAREIKENVVAAAEENGLKDVSVVSCSWLSDYELYQCTVECSNFEEFSNEQILQIVENINNAVIGVAVMDFKSNGNDYEVYTSTKGINKNGEEYYNDYYNSDSYKSAVENKGNSSGSTTTTGEEVTDDDELGVCWALAKDSVESYLKSPSSAKFPFSYGDSDVSITKSGNTYTVKAWVEAENSFGATLRNDFTVTMEKSGSGDSAKFTTKSVYIDE